MGRSEGAVGNVAQGEEGAGTGKGAWKQTPVLCVFLLSYQLRFFSCISKSFLFLLAASSLLCRLLFCCEAVNVSSCLFGGIGKESMSTHSKPFPRELLRFLAFLAVFGNCRWCGRNWGLKTESSDNSDLWCHSEKLWGGLK